MEIKKVSIPDALLTQQTHASHIFADRPQRTTRTSVPDRWRKNNLANYQTIFLILLNFLYPIIIYMDHKALK